MKNLHSFLVFRSFTESERAMQRYAGTSMQNTIQYNCTDVRGQPYVRSTSYDCSKVSRSTTTSCLRSVRVSARCLEWDRERERGKELSFTRKFHFHWFWQFKFYFCKFSFPRKNKQIVRMWCCSRRMHTNICSVFVLGDSIGPRDIDWTGLRIGGKWLRVQAQICRRCANRN